MIRFWICAFALFFSVVSNAYAAENVYMGVNMTNSPEPPGISVSVVRDTPAYNGGLRTGDVIIAVDDLVFSTLANKIPGNNSREQFEKILVTKKVGDKLNLRILRPGPQMDLFINNKAYTSDYPLQDLELLIKNSKDGDDIRFKSKTGVQELSITITLGVRPEAIKSLSVPPNDQLFSRKTIGMPEVRKLVDKLVSITRTQEQYNDLLKRLDARATPDDGFRLNRVSYLLRDAYEGETITRNISQPLQQAAHEGISGLSTMLSTSSNVLDLDLEKITISLDSRLSADEHLKQLEAIITTTAEHVKNAFAAYTPEELAFIESQREHLTEVYKANNYINDDENTKRVDENVKLINLAKKLNYKEILLAQFELSQISNSNYLKNLKNCFIKEYADKLNQSEVISRDTPFGKIIVQGTGRTWRQPVKDQHEALIIDLGGDDFYTNTAGSGISLKYPVGILLELDGNDAYESTLQYSQGSGSMGVGMLIDIEGDDQYVGLEWAQGCGFFGGGVLLDSVGDDIYKGEELVQAAAIFGNALLVDFAGNDRMEAQCKAQAFGGAHSVAFLIDVTGNDYRYAKGKYPTNYGDPGIFDSWSQGCGDGFRQYASGGIAGLIDMAGDDYTEAGNFSTGGGYYYGYGFYQDTAQSNDKYIGSRYNQGFCAHQAVGVFLEDGGDDYYHTRQAVAQGLAWDECTTVFIDANGNDRYEGGGGFSQGASAHNAICIMWDKAGKDTYVYPAGQARAGGNDYHGGTSLSLFIDEGGKVDIYDWTGSNNNLITGWPEYGFFCDLSSNLQMLQLEKEWINLWKEPEFLSAKKTTK